MIRALIQALGDIDEAVCQAAASALAEIGELLAIASLIEALADENPEVRFYAMVALDQMDGRIDDAPPSLIAALDDETEGVQYLAAVWLKDIGTSKAVKAVEGYEQNQR